MRKLVWTALFISLSVVGGLLKIPVGLGSVGLDSMPALTASILLGPVSGAAAGGLGHLLSALTGGFPLGPFHLFIALEMAVLLFLFPFIYYRNQWTGYLFFIIFNSLVLPFPFFFIMDHAFYWTLVPALTAGAVINVVVFRLVLPKLTKAVTWERGVEFNER
ncbi:ECF transporter S component [Halobacillus litoralis]|uniref:ECF transporter S component n=1 Tax=Halobacillus litoralis TaxID=45668 RepID=A0A845DZV0_9BACI|nr:MULTISPECIES: ECF transporter S component [Halobacillus]MYL19557.1 ECF transporter S component [Halobacillus litoralis]MYL28702.1 ECF transporter S component [Halobacillus halophilus]